MRVCVRAYFLNIRRIYKPIRGGSPLAFKAKKARREEYIVGYVFIYDIMRRPAVRYGGEAYLLSTRVAVAKETRKSRPEGCFVGGWAHRKGVNIYRWRRRIDAKPMIDDAV